MSIATTSLWVFAYLGNQVFPLMQKYLGNAGAFWSFSGMALVNFFYVFRWVPETKGHSLEDIEHIWQKGRERTGSTVSISLANDKA